VSISTIVFFVLISVAVGNDSTDLLVAPPTFALHGVRARQQLLVTQPTTAGREADVTHVANYESLDSKIAEVTPEGVVIPHVNGATTIRIVVHNRVATADVSVTGCDAPAPVDFRAEVIAALSKAGCSQGACHGSPQGKGGFRLSLRGFDPALDLQTLGRDFGGRRTNLFEPDASLILRKGSGRMAHQGGVRFKPTDATYQTLLSWIEEGCRDTAQTRKLTALEVIPAKRKLALGHPQQQIMALARFNDGSVEDVTHRAVFSTGMDSAYRVSADGLVTFKQTAEASVLVRYLEQVRNAELTYIDDDPDYAFRGPASQGEIDEHVFAKQRSLQLQPAPLASDEVFLRRVFLDVIGTLPTESEARAFLASTAADKRSRLIDDLLARDDFAKFWALKWADVMRGNRNSISERGVHSMHRYLTANFTEDRPFNEVAREILTSLGNTLHQPAANFYRVARTPDDAAESFGQLFLGVRINCAKCHNHPFEAITQSDYYGLAAYFAQVKLKGKQFGKDDEIVYLNRTGNVQHPTTKATLQPVVFGVPAGELTPDDDRRARLADWLTNPDNRHFARSTVNRIWYHLLGKGIVEPVDDFRDTNPPSNPALLDALARKFASSGYRFRPVIRDILNSQTYQLSGHNPAPQSPKAANPARYFTQAAVRIHTAEQAIDAISAAVGVPEKFPGYPLGTRAIELAEGSVENDFLMSMSRPIRDAACDCAREEDPSLGAVLHLLNNGDLVERIKSPESRIGRLLAAKKPVPEIVESMYLSTLSRRPTAAEQKLAADHLAESADAAAGLQDLQHALLNSSEFLLRH